MSFLAYCFRLPLLTGAASGDAITVESTAYTVRVIQPEGTDLTMLVLEKEQNDPLQTPASRWQKI